MRGDDLMSDLEKLSALNNIESAIRGESDQAGVSEVEGDNLGNKYRNAKTFVFVRDRANTRVDHPPTRKVIPSDKLTRRQMNEFERNEDMDIAEVSGERFADFVDEVIEGDSHE